MSSTLLYTLFAAVGGSLLAAVSLAVAQGSAADGAGQGGDAPLAHMVFFKLADPSAANLATMVEACQKYLSDHEGTLHFSVGVRAAEYDREVNAKDFDIALHLVFKNKAAHDVYQTHPRHVEFIEQNKALWAGVRVYDSYLAPAPQGK
jgi:hypothetical protein